MTADPHPSREPPAEAPEFSAVAVTAPGAGPRRAAAVAAVVVLLLATAVAKPWQQPSAEQAAAVEPTPIAVAPSASAATASASPPSTGSPPPTPLQSPLPPLITVALLIDYHDAWGVRAILGGAEPSERWAAAPLPMPDGAPALDDALVRVLHVRSSERPVRLLGLTTPMGVGIGDVEIAVARPVAGTDRVEFRPANAVQWHGRTLLFTLPDGGDWAPGIYQFRVETGATSTSLAVAILAGSLRR